jgi:hypothetical protein
VDYVEWADLNIQAAHRSVFQAPWLVVFETLAPLKLLDLTGDFATRMRVSMARYGALGSR